MLAPPKPKPDFGVTAYLDRRLYPCGLKPTPVKWLHFDCIAAKLSPSGTTLSSHNCELCSCLIPKISDTPKVPCT